METQSLNLNISSAQKGRLPQVTKPHHKLSKMLMNKRIHPSPPLQVIVKFLKQSYHLKN